MGELEFTDKRIGRTLLGRYVISGVLASGSQGEVFLVTDLAKKGLFAAKLSRRDSPDPSNEARLRQEAEILRRVNSPYVVRLVECGRDRELDSFCVVEELVSGVPLSQVLAGSGPMPFETVMSVVRQLADGLTALHEAGWIMRDLNPSQVIVNVSSGRWQCKLVDLGFARKMKGGSILTDAMLAAGTPGYTAPDLAAGGSPGPAADVYSLAALTWHMLAGRPPFPTTSSPEALLALQMAGGVEPLPAGDWASGGCSRGVNDVLIAALSPIAADRPATPAEFVRLINRASRLTGPRAEKRRWWLAAGAIALALLAWLLYLLLQ